MKRLMITELVVCLVLTGQASGQEPLFANAEEAAKAGDLQLMLQSYEQILRAQPNNGRAMNGRAMALAWDGHYDNAAYAYQQALSIAPDNLESLIGLGYTWAWAGEYASALSVFRRTLLIAPDNWDAQKGEAYVYLWSDEPERAAREFEKLALAYPDDGEILVALGHARLQLGKNRDASIAFDRALATDSERDDARDGRKAAYNATPQAEIAAWYGSTTGADSGLRLAELAYWFGPDTRLAARYDDSLSLDNPALARSGENAETYLATLMHRFDPGWTVNVDLGQRNLPDGTQNLYRAELKWSGELARLTFGAQIGDHELGYEDTLSYIGVAVPVGDHWQFESNTYFSSTGIGSDDEWRSIINAEYNTSAGLSVLAGGGYGETNPTGAAIGDSVKVAHMVAAIPIFGYHRLHLVYRHEEVAGENFNTAMIGITLQLPRN